MKRILGIILTVIFIAALYLTFQTDINKMIRTVDGPSYAGLVPVPPENPPEKGF